MNPAPLDVRCWLWRPHPAGVELVAVRATLRAAAGELTRGVRLFNGTRAGWREFSTRMARAKLPDDRYRPLDDGAPPRARRNEG